MEDNNLLTGGIETLNEIKDNLLELREYQAKCEKLRQEEERQGKSIQAAEKALSEEITSTVKKRRQEIEGTFDDQMNKIRARAKKIKDKRDKRKNLKMSERINEETASLREENNRLKMEAKTLFKQNHIPAYCNTKLFYALYYPKHFEDLWIILATLLITLFIIPCGIYFYILPEEKILYLILIYIITVILFGGLYLRIGSRTKDKHSGVFKQVRALRSSKRANDKKIKAIKKSIRKDRDESTYDLENFDEELARLNKEEADIAEQKKDSLLVFDNTTSQVITSEIKSQHEAKLTGLRSDYDKVNEEFSSAQDKTKALTIKIASEYEPFIGKDLMTLDRLETLTNIILAGNATTISEAVAFHRQNIN